MQLSIVTIGAFVGILNQATKYIAENFIKKDISKFIPIFSVVYGIILGIIGFYLPNADMGSNLVEAIFIGISAGSASTGVHQIGKQLSKDDASNVEQANDETDISANIAEEMLKEIFKTTDEE